MQVKLMDDIKSLSYSGCANFPDQSEELFNMFTDASKIWLDGRQKDMGYFP